MTPVRCVALLFTSLLLATSLSAQESLGLRSISGGRGEVILGEGGLVGSPVMPVVGSLGATAAWVDLNGDGFDDYVFGAPDEPGVPSIAELIDAGHVYVIFGSADAGAAGSDPDLDLVSLAVGEGVDFRGRVDDLAGSALACAGDVDGDGFDDLLIGAPGFNQPGRPGSGSAYVLWGAMDWPSQDVDQSLKSLLDTGRATRFVGARTFGQAGAAVGGNVDVDADGLSDLVIGAPLDSTNGLMQNGSASIVYGNPAFKGAGVVDLATLGAGEITEVEGATDFQFLGSAVVGLGRFDPVLPGTGGAEDLVDGDDVALGAPGTLVPGGLFGGAVYVVRGQVSGPLAESLDASDFSGGDSAGHTYLGRATGDQAGAMLHSAGDLFGDDGFVELVIGAPFDDGPGRPDTGVHYIVPGRLNGANPTGFDLGNVGPGDGLSAIRIFGAGTQDGVRGVFASGVGDFDLDGEPDLAVGFPAASVLVNGSVITEGGFASYLSGAALDPSTQHTIDLAGSLAGIELLRLYGEALGAHGGSSLAAGDANDDGVMDLLIGASGAPSDPSPLDPTGLAFSKTGRGQVIFGPFITVTDVSPSSSWFEGPSVFVTVTGSATDLLVTFDGVAGTILGVTGSDPYTIEVAVPSPLFPGDGDSVDVAVVAGGAALALPDAFTYIPFSTVTGPEPSVVTPNLDMAFTGLAVSSPENMFVTVGGVGATVSESDPLAGTFSVTTPEGLAQNIPLDIEFTTSNGSGSLPDAVTVQAFVVSAVSPNTGPQAAGINVPNGTPGFSYFGEPDYPVEVTVATTSGSAPPETVVEFGNAVVGFEVAEVTGIVGEIVTVNLPYHLLGPSDVAVDVRVTTDEGVVSLVDGFTYEASDFQTIRDTENAGFGGVPELIAAGDYRPNGQALILMKGWPAAEAQFAVGFMGFDLFDPLAPFFGGLLGPMPAVIINVIVVGQDEVALQLNHSPTLGPEGLQIWTQLVVQENNGVIDDWSHSAMLLFTVGPE
ncbi:MAG: hypothetical protein P8N09_02180 [Planctomycetota bacterium]|nr:hypothetical protein [Planctomycetota bacterium]